VNLPFDWAIRGTLAAFYLLSAAFAKMANNRKSGSTR
jgi:hypothetical protein